jgi:hypothetical protein
LDLALILLSLLKPNIKWLEEKGSVIGRDCTGIQNLLI